MYTFPSSEVFMSVVTYGFSVYIVVKQCKKAWINSIIIGSYLVLCTFTSLSIVYFNTQYPSDVAAGLEFGVVWLSLSIILLEVYRVLPKIRDFNGAT
jgi:membrane-associated phospholipid phosphatase